MSYGFSRRRFEAHKSKSKRFDKTENRRSSWTGRVTMKSLTLEIMRVGSTWFDLIIDWKPPIDWKVGDQQKYRKMKSLVHRQKL